MLAPSPSQQSDQLPYGLVSLWDIMQEFNVSGWMTIIEWLMDRASNASQADRWSSRDQLAVGQDRAKHITTGFDYAFNLCAGAGLSTAAELAREMSDSASSPGYTNKKHHDDLIVLKRTIIANMRSLRFWKVASEYSKYAEDRSLWGAAYQAFPSATRDMEDAGKCLAYGMGTATVFHLMRVMEAGLKIFAAQLGIPYAPSWESYLRQLETKFSEDYKKKSTEWKKNEPFYKEVAGDLQLVKFVWRNPTMHIVRSYSQEEAREAFSAVVAFMNRLSLKFVEPVVDDDLDQ